MKIAVICTGDELLKGAVLNTNLKFIGEQLLALRDEITEAEQQLAELEDNGGDNGDLLIKVSIMNDHTYQRDGDDLIRNINIDVYTAILGGKITISTLKGDVNVPIKPQTQNNSTLRLKGLGMPHYDKDGAGALLLKVQLLLPEHFSQKELELIKEAKDLSS